MVQTVETSTLMEYRAKVFLLILLKNSISSISRKKFNIYIRIIIFILFVYLNFTGSGTKTRN